MGFGNRLAIATQGLRGGSGSGTIIEKEFRGEVTSVVASDQVAATVDASSSVGGVKVFASSNSSEVIQADELHATTVTADPISQTAVDS